MSTGHITPNLPPEIALAYREAQARGLPDGWTCTIDKRNRRKWTAPNQGRSCDSIPKALAISVEMGLLPPDTVIPSGKRKKRPSPHTSGSSSSGPSSGAARPAKKPALGSLASAAEGRMAVGKETLDRASSASSDHHHDSQHGSSSQQQQPQVLDYFDYDEKEPPPEPMDPETSLDGLRRTALPTTVHWDAHSPDGSKIGWKVRIVLSPAHWVDGRVVRYDPYTHKHKILFFPSNTTKTTTTTTTTTQAKSPTANKSINSSNSSKNEEVAIWLWLRNEQHNLHLTTRMVWAHVKGYAWWPALVMEANTPEDRKEGYCTVEFFGSGEVATLRDSPECIRPFSPYQVDPVVAKHKKKRNARAYALAQAEYQAIRQTRQEAAIFYAHRAVAMSRQQGHSLVGKRVQFFRSDVRYPYGDVVIGKVRQYSSVQRKWLVAYELSEKTRTKYESSWVNLQGKECALKVLNKKDHKEITPEDMLPFLTGFPYEEAVAGGEGTSIRSQNAMDVEDEEGEPEEEVDPGQAQFSADVVESRDRNRTLVELMKQRCRGCVEYWKQGETRITCEECQGSFHLGCFDPPLSLEVWQRMIKDGTPIKCPRCIPCRGCYQKDIAFGTHAYPKPSMLSFPEGEPLMLCSMCREAYEAQRFCPNCAHSWDDVKFQKVRRQIEWVGGRGRRRKGNKDSVEHLEDNVVPLCFGAFSGDEVLPVGAKVDPAFYFPETSEWGYTEVEMLVCDSCKVWVHAGCAGLDEEEYDRTSEGKHPIYSKEFLCRMCCRQRCLDLIEALAAEDRTMLFAEPVSDRAAPTYRDIIKQPMDLRTMREKAEQEEYPNYAWVREMFELMVLNALTFNRFYTKFWNDAKRYYHECLESVFSVLGRAAPAGKYDAEIQKMFEAAEEYRKMEEDRVQVDESVEKKDLVAGSMAVSVTLPPLRSTPPDQAPCVPFTGVWMKPVDAFYSSWMDCCYTCGSSGASDTLLFCVDCGEAFHTFCIAAPIHSMTESSVAGWRCPNCKICEISGDVPTDENRMLFCEMCDRAFSLELLDPPLKSAPPGLWICGQCVDCTKCGNTAEKRGSSLKHWSRDPEKCYRCGGCQGLVEEYTEKMKCQACQGLLRKDDNDVVCCSQCNARVHTDCDQRAAAHAIFEETASRAQKAQKKKNDDFLCSMCYQPPPLIADSDVTIDRERLVEEAWRVVREGNLLPHGHYSASELHYKLVESVDWCVRDQWLDEYVAVVRDGIRIYRMAKTAFGDARVLVQQMVMADMRLPPWKAERALRFTVLVKRSKLDVTEYSSRKIDAVVVLAKLAASFIDLGCSAMRLDPRDYSSYFERTASLIKPSSVGGIYEPPYDIVKTGVAICLDGIRGAPDLAHISAKESAPIATAGAIIARPMCGWQRKSQSLGDWKDPRECCLCHMCGDDDAGFMDSTNRVDSVPPLGRLLPMLDGYWVHTSCALWSSEVWEDPEDGLIHAVEKARGRGAQLKCFGCGRHGATVGCSKSNCPYNFHFQCAKERGAIFASNQHVYCSSHKSFATGILSRESFEHMKSLMVAPDKKAVGDREEPAERNLCYRIGALVVHSFGSVETKVDGFHSENYIMPPGYVASRIFWSTKQPRTRTLYILRIERSFENRAEFVVLPSDDPGAQIRASAASQAYSMLVERVRKVNTTCFSQGDMFSKLPMTRRTRRKTFGLNGPQFFGIGLNQVRRILEGSSGVEALVAPLSINSPKYKFCFVQPDIDMILDLQRKRAAAKAEQALENSTGCARAEGIKAVARSGGSGRITRALVRSAEEEGADSSTHANTKKADDAEKAKADRSLTQVKYRRMKAIPIGQRLVARRSHIHGWGLFTKLDIPKDDPVVEYMGEIIRQPIADKREKMYEISGEGSCYMFRLDRQRIVDATKIGCMARFMNHSCQPNAYAKIITVDSETGQDRKIVVFAIRDISNGEEITYDYKFPVEDGSLRCTCGAPNCIGRLN